jgi:hypothetical protein
MGFMELVQERTRGARRKVIVVDVQPAHDKHYRLQLDPVNLMKFLNERASDVLVFYNGKDTLDMDTKQEVRDYYLEYGLDESRLYRMEFVDKGYGFFRGWMDNGVDKADIIRTVRFMFRKRIHDSRDINDEDWEKLNIDWTPGHRDVLEDDPIYLPPIRPSLLKRFSGAYIVGGSCESCLAEVELLMSTFNVRAKVVRRFVYV